MTLETMMGATSLGIVGFVAAYESARRVCVGINSQNAEEIYAYIKQWPEQSFMHLAGYTKYRDSCPIVNPNPDTIVGKLATEYNYFRCTN